MKVLWYDEPQNPFMIYSGPLAALIGAGAETAQG